MHLAEHTRDKALAETALPQIETGQETPARCWARAVSRLLRTGGPANPLT